LRRASSQDGNRLAAAVPAESRRVDPRAIGGDDEPLHGRQPVIERQPGGQARGIIGGEHGVVVDQKDERGAPAGDPLVGRAGEPEVAREGDQPDLGKFRRESGELLRP
jgi:hypothetical protein